MKTNSLIDEHFKEQRDYLLSRGITPEVATKLKLEICGHSMLVDRGITWPGVERGIAWRVWDAQQQDTGAVGARVWYKDRGFVKTTDKPKFVTPKGQKPRLYHSPLADWDMEHGDSIVLCESYLKADIVSLCGFKAVGVSGVWGWSHNKAIIEDFARHPWKAMGLKLIVCFDSNVRRDRQDLLKLATDRLAAEMERFGAKVYIVYLPPPDGGGDWGIDDYYMRHGKGAVVDLIEGETERLESTLAQHLHVMNREVAVVRELSKIVDIDKNVFMRRTDFVHVVYADRMHWVTDEKGKAKPKSIPEAWLQWPDRTMVDRVVYRPGCDRIIDIEDGQSAFNMWNKMGCEPKQDKELAKLWERWLVVAFPNEAERWWLCCWFAHQLQELGAKLATSLILVGESGVGKGWLAAIMKRIFGRDNYAPADLGTIAGRFNSDYASKQLLIIEEAQLPRGVDANMVYNRLKDMVTNEELRMERKGVDAFTVENHVNVMLQGNRIDILKLDDFDRRFGVLDVHSGDIANNEDFWDIRWDALEHGLAEAVYAWLLDYDTKGFNPKGMAPMTEAKQEMTETTHTAREQWIMELKTNPESVLQVGGHIVDGYIATAKELEFIYCGGDIPLWEIEKEQAEKMSRALRLARVGKANGGNKLKGSDGVSTRYFVVRPIDWVVGNWKDLIDERAFWKQVSGGKKF